MTEQTEKVLDDDVELTDAPDMITWDDDPENKRAKMPCGHAIGPESLTAYCRSLISAGKCQLFCPYIDRDNGTYCGKIWEYYTVRKLAVLTPEEKEEFERKLSENFMRKASGIQECPKCTSYCIRKNKKDRRVKCLFCSKDGSTYEFCWYCLGKWSNPRSTSSCGNAACSGEDPRLKILREAEKKKIVGLADCPSIRACPKCGMLIYHTRACKHMVCICGQKFCFICLKKAVDGKYQCGTYNSHCKIAPIQVVMPDESEDREYVENEVIEDDVVENNEEDDHNDEIDDDIEEDGNSEEDNHEEIQEFDDDEIDIEEDYYSEEDNHEEIQDTNDDEIVYDIERDYNSEPDNPEFFQIINNYESQYSQGKKRCIIQ